MRTQPAARALIRARSLSCSRLCRALILSCSRLCRSLANAGVPSSTFHALALGSVRKTMHAVHQMQGDSMLFDESSSNPSIDEFDDNGVNITSTKVHCMINALYPPTEEWPIGKPFEVCRAARGWKVCMRVGGRGDGRVAG